MGSRRTRASCPAEPSASGWSGRFLDEPRIAFGESIRTRKRAAGGEVIGMRDAHLWSCALSLHPEEPDLDDSRWGALADRFVEHMGFAGEAAGRAQCRWIAIRHGRSPAGCDHIHIVVGLVAQNGTHADVWKDYRRAQEACRALEHEFGLRRTGDVAATD